jgi:hypothetical protein
MKKIYILSLLTIVALALAACSGINNQSGQNASGTGQPGQGFGNRPMSPQMELAVGTFKLEGTPQAVDAKEAAQLLPLWQLFGQLESSSSSAPQEVTAVVDQIKSAMTPDQANAITAMKLTTRDAFTFMQQQGIVQAGGFGFNGTPDPNRTPRAGGNGGGFPGGGFVPGGAGGNGQNFSPSQIATAQARRAQGGGFSNRLPQALLDALIKLLQAKISPTTTTTPTPANLSTATPVIILSLTPTP